MRYLNIQEVLRVTEWKKEAFYKQIRLYRPFFEAQRWIMRMERTERLLFHPALLRFIGLVLSKDGPSWPELYKKIRDDIAPYCIRDEYIPLYSLYPIYGKKLGSHFAPNRQRYFRKVCFLYATGLLKKEGRYKVIAKSAVPLIDISFGVSPQSIKNFVSEKSLKKLRDTEVVRRIDKGEGGRTRYGFYLDAEEFLREFGGRLFRKEIRQEVVKVPAARLRVTRYTFQKFIRKEFSSLASLLTSQIDREQYYIIKKDVWKEIEGTEIEEYFFKSLSIPQIQERLSMYNKNLSCSRLQQLLSAYCSGLLIELSGMRHRWKEEAVNVLLRVL